MSLGPPQNNYRAIYSINGKQRSVGFYAKNDVEARQKSDDGPSLIQRLGIKKEFSEVELSLMKRKSLWTTEPKKVC